MADIAPQKIYGKWRSGMALALYTNSVAGPPDQHGRSQSDFRRSDIGLLLYNLKYKMDFLAAEEIISAAAGYLEPHKSRFEIIVPVPPSATRAAQPVLLLAKKLGEALGLPVVDCIKTTRPAVELKAREGAAERKQARHGLYAVEAAHVAGKNVLLFDDVYRSGTTMNAATEVLLGQGGAANVDAFAITRTRSNR